VAEAAAGEAVKLGSPLDKKIEKTPTKSTKQKEQAFSRSQLTSLKKIPYIITKINLFVKIHAPNHINGFGAPCTP
jgi:hypothetical protein